MARSGLLSTIGGRRTRRVFQKIPRKGGIRRKRVDYKNVSIFTLESKHPWTCALFDFSIARAPRPFAIERRVLPATQNDRKKLNFIISNKLGKFLLRFKTIDQDGRTHVSGENIDEKWDRPKRLGNTFEFPNPSDILQRPLSTRTTLRFDRYNICVIRRSKWIAQNASTSTARPPAPEKITCAANRNGVVYVL